MKALVLVLLRLYRMAISPLLPQSCRFHPTCSQYAIDAVTVHGVVRGSWLALRRIARCHPWSPGGVDYVPGAGDAEDRSPFGRSLKRTPTVSRQGHI